ncbi:MAG: bifunctional oligoribonuclease/PAP phosphatase NrnA [Turicibacter sp.]|nr:bifunctional oligoribonuclease/PAP phosphatase NrnA [Turicibacter sp.]
MYDRIWETIKQFDKIIIHRHISPDPDAMGSQLGLARIIKENYPEKWVKCVGYSEPSLSWIGTMDEVYNDEYEGALVIVTDTANSQRIDDSRWKNGHTLIKIDHHPDVDAYADINHVDTSSAAASEIIMHMFRHLKEKHQLMLPKEAALSLYAGIIADSGRFLYDSTTVNTLKVVQDLYEMDIDRDFVHANLYKRRMNVVQAEGYVLSNFQSSGSIIYVKMDQAIQKSFKLTTGTRAALVGSLANIEGYDIWVFFFENEDGQIRANIRSRGPKINHIAAQFDGGGHPKASGAMLAAWEDCDRVIAALAEA